MQASAINQIGWLRMVKPIMSFILKELSIRPSPHRKSLLIQPFDIPSELGYIFVKLAGIKMIKLTFRSRKTSSIG